MDFNLAGQRQPFGHRPVFIQYTQSFSRAQRQRTILVSSLTVFIVIAVVPLTTPLLTGPATMSTVVIYAEKAKNFAQLGTLVGYGVVIALATTLCFSLATPIARILGKTGINGMPRLMGLILAALAVEVMADGLHKLFPVLARGGDSGSTGRVEVARWAGH